MPAHKAPKALPKAQAFAQAAADLIPHLESAARGGSRGSGVAEADALVQRSLVASRVAEYATRKTEYAAALLVTKSLEQAKAGGARRALHDLALVVTDADCK